MKNKRILSLVLAFAMLLGTFSFAFADEAVNGPTDNEKVNKLIELGLVKGDAGGYRLEDSIKRSEVAAMVVRAMDKEDVAEAVKNVVTFPDVLKSESDKWANGYINVAYSEGIVNGYPDGTFRPGNDITKAEVVKMMVMILGGLTEEEQKLAVGPNWATIYLAKAKDLEILEGIDLGNANEAAKREEVFELVFNTLTSKDAGLIIANTVEGIVVENYRTERLASDEITVHVMKDQVQREGKYYEKDDEFNVTITPELKKKGLDVETLLGKVVTVSFDKDGKVVDVKVNESYTYLQGVVNNIREKEIQVDGRWYTVSKEEGKSNTIDDRLYQVYLNNEDLHYYDDRDFDKDGEVVDKPRSFAGKALSDDTPEFARITVRNGKVLFIDAFEFKDIAPVAKDVEGTVLEYYDDTDNGEISKLTKLNSAYVVVYEKGEMKLGNYKDIKANDVVHWYTDARGNVTIFVRPFADNNVEGKYIDASARKAKDEGLIYIKVDEDEYPALIESDNRNPVYSTLASEFIFETLSVDYDEQLAGFAKQEVTLLRDMFGYVQLIGSETLDGSFYALVSNTARNAGEIKLLRTDGENVWYGTTRDTVFKGVKKGTKDKEFDQIEKYDLVKVTATEEQVITSIERLTQDGKNVYKINKDIIDFSEEAKPVAGKDFFYLGKNVVVFVENDLAVMDIATFLKNYYKPGDNDYKAEEHQIVAYEENVTKGDVARIIVVKEAVARSAGVKPLRAEVQRVRFTGGNYWLTLLYGDNETVKTHMVAADVDKVTNNELKARGKLIKAGDIVEVSLTKDDNEFITSIERVDLEPARKVSKFGFDDNRREYFVRFADKEKPELIWISKDADQFGKIEVGKWVQYTKEDRYDVVDLVAVVDAPKAKEEPKGIEVYNGTVELDGNTYIILGDETYPFTGKIPADVKEGDKVKPTFITIRGETVVTKIEKVEEPVDPEDPKDPEEPGDEDKPELVEARFYPLVPFDPDTGEPITTGSGQLRIKLANAEDAYEYTVTYYTTGKTEVTSPVVGINAPVLVVWNGEDPMTITIYNEAGDVVATFTGVIPIV